MLPGMTDSHDQRLAEVLRIYADDPLDDGDAVFLLDGAVCFEVAGLADHWDDLLRRNTAQILREQACRAVLAIARPGADLTPSDYQVWRDLHADLRGSAVDLLPVKALPAA